MGTVQLAMLAGLPYKTLGDAMFAHPTMTEGLKALFMGVPERLENHAWRSSNARERLRIERKNGKGTTRTGVPAFPFSSIITKAE